MTHRLRKITDNHLYRVRSVTVDVPREHSCCRKARSPREIVLPAEAGATCLSAAQAGASTRTCAPSLASRRPFPDHCLSRTVLDSSLALQSMTRLSARETSSLKLLIMSRTSPYRTQLPWPMTRSWCYLQKSLQLKRSKRGNTPRKFPFRPSSTSTFKR